MIRDVHYNMGSSLPSGHEQMVVGIPPNWFNKLIMIRGYGMIYRGGTAFRAEAWLEMVGSVHSPEVLLISHPPQDDFSPKNRC